MEQQDPKPCEHEFTHRDTTVVEAGSRVGITLGVFCPKCSRLAFVTVYPGQLAEAEWRK